MLVLKKKEFTSAANKTANLMSAGWNKMNLNMRKSAQLADASYKFGAPSYGKAMTGLVTQANKAKVQQQGLQNLAPKVQRAKTTGAGAINSDSYLNKPMKQRLQDFKYNQSNGINRVGAYGKNVAGHTWG